MIDERIIALAAKLVPASGLKTVVSNDVEDFSVYSFEDLMVVKNAEDNLHSFIFNYCNVEFTVLIDGVIISVQDNATKLIEDGQLEQILQRHLVARLSMLEKYGL